MLLLAAMHVNTSLKALLHVVHLFSDTLLYGQIGRYLIFIAEFIIMNLLSVKIGPFYENFILQKSEATYISIFDAGLSKS